MDCLPGNPDLLSDSTGDAIGAREEPVKHKPDTAYVQNHLLTDICFQYLNSDSLKNEI